MALSAEAVPLKACYVVQKLALVSKLEILHVLKYVIQEFRDLRRQKQRSQETTHS